MGTRMEAMAERLRELREERDFDRCFDYAVYLALQLIESDRVGRRFDEAVRRNMEASAYARTLKETAGRCLERDGFFEAEKAFYEEFDGTP